MKIDRHSSPTRQHGQATVEMVVLGFVMVPLILAIPLLGKYMDIAQTAAIASRYVAFEGVVRHSSSNDGWKTDDELSVEVRRRFFSNSDAPIKTDDVAGDFNAHRNTLWFDHQSAALLPEFATNVSVTTQRESLAQPIGAVFNDSFDLSHDNLNTGAVQVKVADIEDFEPFDTLGLVITRSTTLLADPWAASGPASVKDKIAGDGSNLLGAFPYEVLKIEASVLEPFINLLEFNSQAPEVGKVEPDRVPKDRLGGG